jgi:hypothetical protein
MTFSMAVWCGKSWKFWNTMPVCRRIFWMAGQPIFLARRKVSFSSPMRIVPAVGISSRLMQRSSVLLPPPDGPTRPVTLPSAMRRLMSFRMIVAEAFFDVGKLDHAGLQMPP